MTYEVVSCYRLLQLEFCGRWKVNSDPQFTFRNCRFPLAIRNSLFAIRNWSFSILNAYLNEYNKRNKLDQ